MTNPDPYATIDCPMPDCEASLSVVWESAATLYRTHLDTPDEPPVSGGAGEQTWKIACYEGHVLLLPGGLGCPAGCEDDCTHGVFDYREEWRNFGPHDVERLRKLLDTMTPAVAR